MDVGLDYSEEIIEPFIPHETVIAGYKSLLEYHKQEFHNERCRRTRRGTTRLKKHHRSVKIEYPEGFMSKLTQVTGVFKLPSKLEKSLSSKIFDQAISQAPQREKINLSLEEVRQIEQELLKKYENKNEDK